MTCGMEEGIPVGIVVPVTGFGDDALGSTMMDEGMVCVVKVAVPVGRMVCGPVVGKVCGGGIVCGGFVETPDCVSAEGVVIAPEVLMLTDPDGLEFCVPDGLAETEPDAADPVTGTVSVKDPEVMTV